MMTEQQRIEWFLELQDHPEQLTDEQLQQLLANDEMTNEQTQSDAGINSADREGIGQSQMRRLVKQLGFAKRAFKHDALKNDIPDVDAEWETFAASHAEELDALDEGKRLRVGNGTSGIRKPRFRAYLAPHKIAASFIGVLLASGTAFAVIQVVRNISTPKPQQPTTEQATDIGPVTSLPADTVKADTISTEPYVFNNVPLDSILTTIATVHEVGVKFENDAARQFRFHFVWKREDSLTRVVEKLNTFEAVNIGVEDKALVVR
ncbi:MAG: DUF4974 domain-containing protein [Bacteroidaceae bacterium]|nr:DUF4974 domain-containing protein [Bacteroidaceae bacterium]